MWAANLFFQSMTAFKYLVMTAKSSWIHQEIKSTYIVGMISESFVFPLAVGAQKTQLLKYCNM
jgi:hypothetical protein